ncbi:RHTO0S10e05006g2_1 [Rhodotorula toruloides]|uniref:RHTO0S10e05006g2_1 n=3 Tax=Rhodotorula toruloides TaxID=5286 RepID=A0A061BB48_RHOTO|nr:RHTO0S10e05006g2_1 [Rhodotorula toruloides]
MAHTGQPVSISVHPDLRDDWTALVNAVELFISNDPGCREYTRTRAYALFPPPFVTPDWPAVQHALVTQFGAEQGDDQAGIETGVYGAAYIAGVLKKTLVPDDRLCMHAIKVWLRRFTNALESCNTRIVQPNKIASPTPSTRDAFAATAVALTATSSASYKVGESSSSLVRTPSNSSSTSSDSTDASQKGRNAESPTPFSTPESLDERTTRQARHASAPSPSPKPEVKLEDVALDPIVRPIATTRLLRPKTEELGPVPALNDGRRRSSRLTRSRSPSPDLEDTKPFASPVPARKKRQTAAASPSPPPLPQFGAPQTSAAQYFASVLKGFRGLDGLDLEPDAPLRNPRLAALDCAFKHRSIAGPKVQAMFHGFSDNGYEASRNFVAIWPKHNLCAPDTFAYGRPIAILADEDKLKQYIEVIVPPHRSADEARPLKRCKPVDAPETGASKVDETDASRSTA